MSCCAILACQSAPAPLAEAAVTAIRAATARFVENGLARRDSANAADYSEDGVFMPPNQPAVEGRAAIRAWFAAFPPMSAFNLTVVEVKGRGDLADGSWTMTADIFNSDVPLPGR